MYNPLEYDLVRQERQRQAEAARRYVVRSTEPRQRAGRKRTSAAARGRQLWADTAAGFRTALRLPAPDDCGCERSAQRAH